MPIEIEAGRALRIMSVIAWVVVWAADYLEARSKRQFPRENVKRPV